MSQHFYVCTMIIWGLNIHLTAVKYGLEQKHLEQFDQKHGLLSEEKGQKEGLVSHTRNKGNHTVVSYNKTSLAFISNTKAVRTEKTVILFVPKDFFVQYISVICSFLFACVILPCALSSVLCCINYCSQYTFW